MSGKRHTAEEIVNKLREADVLLSKGHRAARRGVNVDHDYPTGQSRSRQAGRAQPSAHILHPRDARLQASPDALGGEAAELVPGVDIALAVGLEQG